MRFTSGLSYITSAIKDVGEAVKVATDQKDLTMGDRTKRGKVTDNGDDE